MNANEMENDENSKRCAVCLEDFEPRQEVMLTPCRHMFHEVILSFSGELHLFF